MQRALAFLFFASLLPAQQYRAFWADAFHPGFKTPEQIDALLEHLTQAKANAIFIQARRRADSYFRQSSEPFAQDNAVPAGFDPLEDLIRKAKARSIEVHAWIVVYPAWFNSAPPLAPNHLWNLHGPAARGRDNWVNYNAAGAPSLAIDPGHPDVLPYLVEAFLEPVQRYNVDGLHLDYVRYPEDADYGYNPEAIERFNRQLGRAGRPRTGEAPWSDWRRRQVTALVRQLYLRLQQVRPEVKLSAATITWGNGPLNDAEFRQRDAYSRVFQDWRGWLEEGILDFAMPMNYFDEARFAGFLDRWTEFQKNHQGRRAVVNGLGNYLNTTQATLNQLQRVLAPSASGNSVLGAALYSYSATDAGNTPQLPSPAFYEAIGGFFGAPAQVPVLPWKQRPARGHLLGRVAVNNGPEWLRDGLAVQLENEGLTLTSTLTTDVSGFFGAVELPPGRYRVRAFDQVTPFQTIEAGKAAEFTLAIDGDRLLPALDRSAAEAAPGDVVRLTGRNLAPDWAPARAVPLPTTLSTSLVLVNGQPAPLFEIGPGFVEFQLPYANADRWEIVFRRPGFDSLPLVLNVTPANPRILGARRAGGDAVEIYATGLGPVSPATNAGAGGNAEEPYHRCTLPIKVEFATAEGWVEAEPLYAGLTPYLPGRYQVNALVPTGATGGVRVVAGGIRSAPAQF